MSVKMVWFHVVFVSLCVLKEFYVLCAAAEGGNCQLPDHDQCTILPDVCQDASLSHLLCPHLCGFCDITVNALETTTHSTPTTTPTPHCMDHMFNGMRCQDVPSICKDMYAKVLCPKFCGTCGQTTPATTTPHHTTHPPATTQATHTTGNQPQSSSPHTTTVVVVLPDCMDYVGLGKTCDMIPDVCNDIYGRLLCKKHCHLCNSTAGDVTPPPGSTTTPGECVDHVVNNPNVTCLRLPGVCSDSLAAAFCPKLCNKCATPHTTTPHSTLPHTTHTPATTHSTTTAATTTTATPCEDAVGPGMDCGQLQATGFCRDAWSLVVCKKTCNHCPTYHPPSTTATTPTTISTTTTTPCEDAVGLGMDCGQLQATGFCRDAWSMVVCKKTCNHCPGSNTGPTTPTTAGNTVTPSPLCMDHTLNGLTCSAEVCAVNSIANSFCARSCGLCSHQCIDHIYNGMSCQDVPSICKDQYAKQLCPKFCGVCTTTDSPIVIG